MQVEARVAQQPPLDVGRFVRRVVIQDQVHLEMGGHLLVDVLEELLELCGAMAAVHGADHLACGHVERKANKLVVPWRT